MQATPPTVLDAPSERDVAVQVEEHLREVLDRVRDQWSAVDPWLAEPLGLLTDFALSGGKRLRPLFCRFGFLGAGGDPSRTGWLDLAAGLELLHAFALLHDDVMDGSTTRRGRPALHHRLHEAHRFAGWRGEGRRFGEGVAVLVGDLAFALADRLMRSAGGDVGPVWDELRTELVMGQYLDVVGTCRGPLRTERALLVARYKSGAYTVERPLHLGAAYAGRLDELSAGYSGFGRPLGEAFQLRDDLLGVFGDESITGKPVGEDLREGKPTVLLAVARPRTTPAGRRLLDRVGAPGLADGEIDAIRQVLLDSGARDVVEQMIERRHATALRALDSVDVPEAVRSGLRVLAAQAAWRAD